MKAFMMVGDLLTLLNPAAAAVKRGVYRCEVTLAAQDGKLAVHTADGIRCLIMPMTKAE